MCTHVEFRQIDGPHWKPGTIWQAELHENPKKGQLDCFNRRYPIALAWVSDDEDELLSPTLEYVLVPDHDRRNGLAKALVLACVERFPGLRLSNPISDEGEALLGSVARHLKGFS